MPSETTSACVRLLVFFKIRRGTFPYGVENDASTISLTPTTHYTNTCVKLTIVTHLSFSERLAIANLSFKVILYGKRQNQKNKNTKRGNSVAKKNMGRNCKRPSLWDSEKKKSGEYTGSTPAFSAAHHAAFMATKRGASMYGDCI